MGAILMPRVLPTARALALTTAAAVGLLLPCRPLAQGPEISDFNFYNTDLHLVLKALAEVSGVTFVEDVPVSGKVTIHVATRTGLEEVLDNILKPLGLAWKAAGNVYHVGLKAGEKAAAGRPGYIQKTFTLKNAAAGEAGRRLRKFLRARGVVSVEYALNQLTVTTPPGLLPDVENLINAADVETGKKLISVRIKVLEIFRGNSMETAATLEWQKYPATMGLAGPFADTLNYRRDWGDRMPESRNAGSVAEYLSAYRDAATFKIGVWGIDDFVARLKLEAFDNHYKDVIEQDLTVLEGQEATTRAGQVPWVRNADNVLIMNDDNLAGVDITVKPQVAKGGRITMDVTAARNIALAEMSSRANLFQRRVDLKTTLSLSNGETGRLGGILAEDEKSSEDKVPLLGDLPLFGFLFKSRTTLHGRTETVILVAPSIVEDVPPHGRRSAGISALVAWLKPGTTDVVVDWSEDVPTDNVGVFRYKVYRDTRPILSVARLAPVADAVPRGASSWADEGPKKRGATYYYAVIAVDGAGNEQAVSNSPAITVPRR